MNSIDRPPPAAMNISTQVELTVHSYEKGMLTTLLSAAHAQGDATFSVFRRAHVTLLTNPSVLLDRFASRLDWQCLRPDSSTLIIRATGLFGTIEAHGGPDRCLMVVQLWTDTPQRGDNVKDLILADVRPFEVTDISFCLNWRFLDGKGDIRRASTEERASGSLLGEAYPALTNVNEFIEQYLDAAETVLVLQGSPGTGKTRLIRAILAAISRRKDETAEVLYTGDSAVLQNDEVFLEFIVGTHSAFVVEDADHLLTPRSGGNQTLHRFLNIADGIASAHGKKIVFSTNLPNIRDIDDALVRPGRCFAHIYLKELQFVEAIRLLDRLCADNPDLKASALTHLDPVGKKAYSVAEVYAAYRNARAPSIPAQLPRLGAARDPDRGAFGFN
jgi:hypothetical protein